MKIGTDFANEGAHVRFRKDDNGVDVGQRRQNFRALLGRGCWPPFAFQCAHGSVGVDRDNQFATEFPRGVEIAYMAHMQKIEAPVGQCDAIPGAPPIYDKLL